MNGALLLDNSAWSRLHDPRLPAERRAELRDLAERGALVVSLPLMLEAGYSARNGHKHGEIIDELSSMRRRLIDEKVEQRAIEAQAELARSAHHRIPPADLMLAALADRHELGILHYDADYDLIRERTALRYESVWLADRGAL